jgi:hypothetical protein
MQTKLKPAKSAQQIEAIQVRKADAAARLELLQDRQRQVNDLRQQHGYLGDDETVLAMHWLDVAFTAVPSLSKWAATKTVDGRKPAPVQLKSIVFNWLHQPACHASRSRVYQALTGGQL